MFRKILLVEDEQGIAQMYKKVLNGEGVEVELAITVEEGRQTLKKKRPDLILLDILLPKESGLDFLEEIRGSKDFSDIPVIILSNYDAQETKSRAEKLGIVAYLMKADYTPKELIEKIQGSL